jgi:dipeptidase
MWGAEMGSNEHGVAIGNEAVFARKPAQVHDALLGMDLVRLGLERGATAAEALQIMTGLLERYGQGGNCGLNVPSYYHNSFLVADPTEAYVLETLGRDWLIEQVRTVRAISNTYTVDQPPLRASKGLQGFGEEIADRDSDASGRRRCARSTALLARAGGALTVAHMVSVLRDHGPEVEGNSDWRPRDATFRTICMHATGSEPRGQTVGSLVSELRNNSSVHWVTGTAAPCTSIYKPVIVGIKLPAAQLAPTGEADSAKLWWRHEPVHQALAAMQRCDLTDLYQERNALEAEFRSRIDEVADSNDRQAKARAVSACWQEADLLEHRWHASLDKPCSDAPSA